MSEGAEDTGRPRDVAEGKWPQYRVMNDGRHLYRIDAPDRFVELQRIGTRWVRHEVLAKVYPEMVRIHTMLAGGDGLYEPISAAEWALVEQELPSAT